MVVDPGQGRPRRRRPGRPRPRPRRRRDHRRRRGAGRARRRRRGRLHGVGRRPARRRRRPTSRGACARGRGRRHPGALRALRPRATRPPSCASPLLAAAKEGGARAVRQRRRPGLGQRRAARCWSARWPAPIDQVRCQEIFDYSTYDAARRGALRSSAWASRWTTSRRWSRPACPTMVWGGQVRLIARALGVELDEIRETARAPPARRGRHQRDGRCSRPAPRARCASRSRASSTASRVIVVEHVTRIAPGVRPRLAGRRPTAAPAPTGSSSRAARASRSASRPPTRAATAPPAATPPPPTGSSTPSPGCAPRSPVSTTGSTYPLAPADRPHSEGRHRMIIDVPEGKDPIIYVWGEMVPGIGPAAVDVRPGASTSTPRSACASSRPPGCGSPRSTAACSARTGAPSATA